MDTSPNNFIPQLLYWCDKCNEQKLSLRQKSFKDEDIKRIEQCPECNSDLFKFWAEIDKDAGFKMVIYASLFLGGVITNAISSLGDYGLIPIIVLSSGGIISLLVGGIGGFRTNKAIRTVDRRPPNAGTSAPLGPNQNVSQTMINYGLKITVGGFLTYFIISVIAMIA